MTRARWESWAPAALALFLGLWGISWNLPSKDRFLRVLPPAADTPEFRETLRAAWDSMYEKMGPDILLSPLVYSYGFEKRAEAAPEWELPPPLLYSPARSFLLRTGHEDESNLLVALSRIKPHRLEFNPRIYFYGGTYMYLLGGWIAATSVWNIPALRSSVSALLEHPERAAWLYLSGRLFSAAVYLAGTLLVGFVGRRLFGARAGAFAAALFAASPGIAIQSHYLKPHLLGSVFILAAFYFCVRVLQSGGRPRHWLLAGAFIGLAGGSAFYQATGGFLLGLAFLFRVGRQGASWRRELPRAAAGAAAAAAAFLLFNFYLFLEPATSLAAIRKVAGHGAMDPGQVLRFLWRGLPSAMTVPIALWVLAGLAARGLFEDEASAMTFCAFTGFALSAYMFQSVDSLDSIRYFAGASFGCLLAGRRFARWLESPSRGVRRAAAAAGLLAVAFGASYAGVVDYNFHLDATDRSTHHAAGAWIERELPAGSELGFLRLPQPANSPYFQWNRYRLKFFQPSEFAALADAKDAPAVFVMVYPGYDEGPQMAATLGRYYTLLKSFEPAALPWARPPRGQAYSNPLIEIYVRK